MNDLSLIKWHAQELCKLLEKDPNNPQMARLYVELETTLNSYPFKQIESIAPGGMDEKSIKNDDI